MLKRSVIDLCRIERDSTDLDMNRHMKEVVGALIRTIDK